MTAAQHFEKALQKKNDDSGIHYKMAVTYYNLGRFTLAKEHFMETYRLQANYAKTLQYLGLIFCPVAMLSQPVYPVNLFVLQVGTHYCIIYPGMSGMIQDVSSRSSVRKIILNHF